jgi:hypothetical protein
MSLQTTTDLSPVKTITELSSDQVTKVSNVLIQLPETISNPRHYDNLTDLINESNQSINRGLVILKTQTESGAISNHIVNCQYYNISNGNYGHQAVANISIERYNKSNIHYIVISIQIIKQEHKTIMTFGQEPNSQNSIYICPNLYISFIN